MMRKFLFGALLTGSVVLSAADNPVLAQKADYPCRETGAFEFRGNPEDWRNRGAVPLFLTGDENRMIPDWNGSGDVEVTVWLLHDKDFLYIGGLVQDKLLFKQKESGALYRGSGFQIAFDPLDDTILPGYDGNDVELGFGMLTDGPAAHCWAGGEAGQAGRLNDVKVKVTELPGDIQFYEAAIPWHRIAPFDPARRDFFGFNILYNAHNGKARRGWVHWTPGIGEEKLTFLFRNVRLVPAGSGRGESTVNTDKGQYADGDPVTASVYLPTDGKAPLAVTLEIIDNGKVIHSETKKTETIPGGTVLRFHYGIGRLQGKGLEAKVTAVWGNEREVLTAEILNLSAEILQKRSKELWRRGEALREKIAKAAEAGVPVDYPLVSAGITETVLRHRDFDLSKPERLRKYVLLPRINRQFNYLESSLVRAEKELAGLLNGTVRRRPVPKTSVDNLVVRDGAFYSGDDPVILIGPHGWWQVYPDIDLIADLGFNHIGGTLIAQDATPAPGKTRTGFGNTILRHIRTMRKHNIAYDFLVSPHPLPEGWKKAHPEMLDYKGSGWIGSSLYVPATRRMIDEMWAVLLPLVKDEPNLVSLNLVNEWSFSDGFKGAPPPVMVKRFQEAMAAKYGSIEKLNAKWKSAYASFEAIDPMTLRSGTPGGFYDWESFRYSEGLENVRFLAATAEKYAPGKLRQIKTIAVTDLNPEQYTPVGVERELRGEVMDIAGSDCASTIHLDYYRSMVPDKPSSDTEFHVSSGITPEEIVSDCWSAILHGQGQRQYYSWANGYHAELQAAGAVLHIPEPMEALGRAALDIRRLTPEIVLFQQAIPKAELGILYSPASLYCDPGYPPSMRQVHSLLTNLDAQVRFVSERQLANDRFDAMKLIVVPAARYLSAATVEALNRFTAKGGQVVYAEGAFESDPYGEPLPKLAKGEKWNPAELDQLLSRSGVSRPVRLGNGRIELRSVTDKAGDTLFYLINYGSAASVQPVLNGKALPEAVELISGETMTFPLPVKNRGVFMFRVGKQ